MQWMQWIKHLNIMYVSLLNYLQTTKIKPFTSLGVSRFLQITSDMFLHEFIRTYTNIHLQNTYQCLVWEKESQRIKVGTRMNIYLAKEYVHIEKLYHSLNFALMTWERQISFTRNELNLSNERDKMYFYWIEYYSAQCLHSTNVCISLLYLHWIKRCCICTKVL